MPRAGSALRGTMAPTTSDFCSAMVLSCWGMRLSDVRLGMVFLVLAVAISAGVPACRSPTQIVFELSTDGPCHTVSAPIERRQTAITLGRRGKIETATKSTAETEQCDPATGQIGTIVAVPSGDNNEEIGARIVSALGKSPADCAAGGDGQCIVARRAVRFIPNRSLTIPIFLGQSCAGIVCDPDSTCDKGLCVPLGCAGEGTCAADGGADASPPDAGCSPNDPAIGTACVTGLPGICANGTWQCSLGVRSCVPLNLPGAVVEQCNQVDDNCDGAVDEGCTCSDGTVQPCGEDKGACKRGTQTCANGQWGSCEGAVGPSPETCNNIDDNCNDQVDEQLTKVCGSSVGACKVGTSTCSGGSWGACVGGVTSKSETCNGLDDDCDGSTDEGPVCEDCIPLPSSTTLCPLSQLKGDKDFGGSASNPSPIVNVTVTFYKCTNNQTVCAHAKVNMREPKSDWSEGERTGTVSASGAMNIGQILTSTFTYSYSDTDHSLDVFNFAAGSPVTKLSCMGDTANEDICSNQCMTGCSGCTLNYGCVRVKYAP